MQTPPRMKAITTKLERSAESDLSSCLGGLHGSLWAQRPIGIMADIQQFARAVLQAVYCTAGEI